MTAPVYSFDNTSTLVDVLCERIASVLEHAVSTQGSASLVVSGGSTPVPLFRALANTDLPWADIVVSLADERWVDESHPDSNAAMVRRELLRDYASTARFVSMKCATTDAFSAQKKLSHILTSSILPIDLVILGMGTDGHTASLFPRSEGLEAALDAAGELICHGIRVPDMPYTRMTLGLAALLQARHRILHIQGESKYQTLLKALEPGPVEDMPVRAVLRADSVITEIFYAP